MADKSFFFTSIDIVQIQYENEKTLSVYQNVDFLDKQAQIRINNLNLKITTHKLIFSNNPELDTQITKEKHSNFLYFLIKYSHITNLEKKYEGIFSKTLDRIKIHLSNQLAYIFGKSLEGVWLQIEGGLQKRDWKHEKIVEPEAKELYMGIKNKIVQKQEEVKQSQETLKSSFSGQFDVLFKNASELQQITRSLSQNLRQSQNQEQSDVNQILQNMGCFQVITRDQAGDNYYNELAKQIYKMCQELFPSTGGIISMIDIFYYFNKKRSISLVSPEEIVIACNQFKTLGFNAKIAIYENNIKVVESNLIYSIHHLAEFNPDKDYERTLGKHMAYEQGITSESLAKKLGLSPLIVRIKLKLALQNGKIVTDNRIEGTRYFKNLILTV